jgi:hypothetical protein
VTRRPYGSQVRRAVALLLLVPACTVGVRRAAPTVSPTQHVATATPPTCSTTYAKPDPQRPVIRLSFSVDATHARVTGTEHVVFTPDRAVTELVFRLWPNGPASRGNGARLDVTRASLPMTLSDGDTLLALPVSSPAGRPVTVDLDFALTLPRSDTDRYGHTARTAWWASAHPLLAWVRGGAGWAREPAVGLLGETATSEAADYDVTVTAPSGDTVLGNAVTDPPVDLPDVKRWHFRNDAARDVAVAVGPFTTRQVRAGAVPVVVAVSGELASGSAAEAVFGPVVANVTDALAGHVRRFGPFPFPTLTVVALDAIGGSGVEYPGLVFVGSRRYDLVVPHEVAHEWFYGLVGDDQARDPWLDEAFATYAEALANDDAERYLGALDAKGDVGAPMAYWDRHRKDYGSVVYGKGAAALLAARGAIGAAAFDAVLRCYVAANAFRVATPADVVTAFAAFPDVLQILRDAGALSR